MDVFLSEGIEVIFRIALTLLMLGNPRFYKILHSIILMFLVITYMPSNFVIIFYVFFAELSKVASFFFEISLYL